MVDGAIERVSSRRNAKGGHPAVPGALAGANEEHHQATFGIDLGPRRSLHGDRRSQRVRLSRWRRGHSAAYRHGGSRLCEVPGVLALWFRDELSAWWSRGGAWQVVAKRVAPADGPFERPAEDIPVLIGRRHNAAHDRRRYLLTYADLIDTAHDGNASKANPLLHPSVGMDLRLGKSRKQECYDRQDQPA